MPELLKYRGLNVNLKNLWDSGKKEDLMQNTHFRKAFFQTFFAPQLPPQMKDYSNTFRDEVKKKRRLFRQEKAHILKAGGKEYENMDYDVMSMVMLYK